MKILATYLHKYYVGTCRPPVVYTGGKRKEARPFSSYPKWILIRGGGAAATRTEYTEIATYNLRKLYIT